MSHPETHGHDTHAMTGDRPYFPEAEWRQFNIEDIAAGKAIILLMAGIFSIGLVLYSIIALICSRGA